MTLSVTISHQERQTLREAREIRARERKAAKKSRPAPIAPTAPGQRRVRIKEPAFLAFLRRQPCAVGPAGCSGPTEAAHVRYGRPGEPNAGLQRRPSDRNAVPLCVAHHREGPDAQHRTSERSWWAARGIDPHALADRFYAQFKGEA